MEGVRILTMWRVGKIGSRLVKMVVLRKGLCMEIGMTIQCFFPFLFLNEKN